MEKFHWTFEDFETQPWDRIELILNMIDIENQFKERELKKEKYGK